MTIAAPNFQNAFVDENGFLTPASRLFVSSVLKTLNALDVALSGQDDPASALTEIIASTGLTGGGALSANVAVRFGKGAFTVANLPTAQLMDWAYALDGRKAGESSGHGTGTWCWFDGTAWKDFDTETVSA